MLYIDLPTQSEFKKLSGVRADACVSISLATTPLSQNTDISRIEFGNLIKEATAQLQAEEFDKRRLAKLEEHLEELAEDDDYWRLQANSLVVLVTPDSIRTFRLANHVHSAVQVSDRFHLSALLRAITFPQSAFVLALSENAVRLVEVSATLPAKTVKIDALPKDAASAVGKSTLNKRAPSRRIQGSEGQNIRFAQYARRVDAALRPVLSGSDLPLILAATGRLASVYHSISSYPNVLESMIETSPDQINDADLAEASRPILDAFYKSEVVEFNELFQTRTQQNRAVSDISEAARAATFGAVEALLVDIDADVPGSLNENGEVIFAQGADATSYEVLNEIASRALANGAKVMGVRREDIPGGESLAAILRFPI